MAYNLNYFSTKNDAFQYLANLLGIHSGHSYVETIQNIRSSIQEKCSFDFNSISDVAKTMLENKDFMPDLRFSCKEVFHNVKLPDEMKFIGLNEYITIVGTPFSKTTFGSGELSISLHGDTSEEYIHAYLLSGCNLLALNKLSVEVSGFADLDCMFSECRLPSNTRIKIDVFPISKCIDSVFYHTVFTGKTDINLNVNLENQSYEGRCLFEGSVFSLFRGCNLPGYVSVTSNDIHLLGNSVFVSSYLNGCNVEGTFRSPIVIHDNDDLHVWFRNIKNTTMSIIPFMGTTIDGKYLYDVCGMDGFGKIDTHKKNITVTSARGEIVNVVVEDTLYDHLKELELLGCVFELEKGVMHLPKCFNKAFQMLHDGSFVK